MSETKLVVCKICGNLPIAGVRRYSLWCRNDSPKHHVEAVGDTREEVIATWNLLNDSSLLEAAEEVLKQFPCCRCPFETRKSSRKDIGGCEKCPLGHLKTAVEAAKGAIAQTCKKTAKNQ